MAERSHGVLTQKVEVENSALGRQIRGTMFTGRGRDVVLAVSEATGMSSIAVLDAIVHQLLVQKGADWTGVILSEYLETFRDSTGSFALVWDELTSQLVAHGCTFQSAANPWAGLLAHIRTLDDFKGLGLGTLVTESVTAAAFDRFAELVVLETDDKLHRLAEGGRAAHSMYSRIGYTILGEKRLADTVDWMMAVTAPIFAECQKAKAVGGGKFPAEQSQEITEAQEAFVAGIRNRFSRASAELAIEPVSPGDLANLFVLLNLCPPDDFRLKLSAWHVHHGPETERTFIATLRQAIVDQDRLQDATMVLRDTGGAVAAVCAAQQLPPFTRQSYAIDFYCLPEFLKTSRDQVISLVTHTIERIYNCPSRPHPCRLLFTGIDDFKCSLFESLGFAPTGATVDYYSPEGEVAFAAREYQRVLT